MFSYRIVPMFRRVSKS